MAVVKPKNGNKVAVKIAKELKRQADSIGLDITRIIDNKLYRTYKDNVIKSYHPRSARGQEIKEHNEDKYNTHKYKHTYHHTHIFERSIGTEIDNGIIRIVINDDEVYRNKATSEETKPSQVYKWLTEGRTGGGYYMYEDDYNSGIAYRYPTPKHLFETQTYTQMQPFYAELKHDVETVCKKNRYVKKYRKSIGEELRRKYSEYGANNHDNKGTNLLRKRY